MDKWTRRISISLVFVLAVALAFAAGGSLNGEDSVGYKDSDDLLDWENEITIQHNGEVIARFHNVLTTQGKQFIRDKISGANATNHNVAGDAGKNLSFIALGNGSEPSSGDTQLPSEITQGGTGLTRTNGGITTYGGGNFSVDHQFTADADVGTVNTTGLNWNSSGSSLVSGGSFSDANILDGDQITVTHNISIS